MTIRAPGPILPAMPAMRGVAGLVLLLALGACSERALLQRRAYLASFVGQSETDLVRALGVPTRSFTVGSETFLAYDSRRLEVLPGYYGGPWWGPGWGPSGGPWAWGPPVVVSRGCDTTYDISGGKVVGLTMHGPDC